MRPRLNHLTFAKLADLADGRSPAPEREAALGHVSECARCAARLGRLEAVVTRMRSDASEDAPPAAVAYALNLFRPRAAAAASAASSRARRLIAALKFDSFGMTPAYGVRSAAGGARQRLYTAGEYELDVRVASGGESWAVSGQVLGGTCAGGRVELEGAAASARAELNEQCEFTLPPVPAGSYNFRLLLPGAEVEIPDLELRA